MNYFFLRFIILTKNHAKQQATPYKMSALSKLTPMQRFMHFIQFSGIDYKQHQYDGVKWCSDNETAGFGGGFVADEMGLGKTLTMIGTCIANPKRHTLIVLPTILIDQWQKEIKRTTGFSPLIFHGTQKKNVNLLQLQSSYIVLCTYNGIQKPGLLHDVEWDRVIFDEAHHLRNRNSRHFGAKLLKTPVRWLISGTPIQNSIKDLFHMCSILGLPASYYMDHANLLDFQTKYVLRRVKRNVGIELPELIIAEPCISWKTEEEKRLAIQMHSDIKDSSCKLTSILRARQVCIFPPLLPSLKTSCFSSKIDSVVELVMLRNNGNGKLIFCHFAAEIDIIISKLARVGITNVASFDGRVPQGERANILSLQYDVLILQIQTGCEGLNLQDKYSEIYFVSPHWNPSIEAQAIARCHRMGQLKPVYVFKFKMDSFDEEEDSFDYRISERQDSKLLISSSIFTS